MACQILFASEDALPSFVADTVRYKGTAISRQRVSDWSGIAGQHDSFKVMCCAKRVLLEAHDRQVDYTCTPPMVILSASSRNCRARHQPHRSCQDPGGHLQVAGRLPQRPEPSEGRSLSRRCFSPPSPPTHLHFPTPPHSDSVLHNILKGCTDSRLSAWLWLCRRCGGHRSVWLQAGGGQLCQGCLPAASSGRAGAQAAPVAHRQVRGFSLVTCLHQRPLIVSCLACL